MTPVDRLHKMISLSYILDLIFKIECVTESGQEESPTIVFDPNAVDNIGKYDIEVLDSI